MWSSCDACRLTVGRGGGMASTDASASDPNLSVSATSQTASTTPSRSSDRQASSKGRLLGTFGAARQGNNHPGFGASAVVRSSTATAGGHSAARSASRVRHKFT